MPWDVDEVDYRVLPDSVVGREQRLSRDLKDLLDCSPCLPTSSCYFPLRSTLHNTIGSHLQESTREGCCLVCLMSSSSRRASEQVLTIHTRVGYLYPNHALKLDSYISQVRRSGLLSISTEHLFPGAKHSSLSRSEV